MELSSFQSLLHLSQAPWLPDAATQYWGLHAAWGLVLGSLTFLFGTCYNFKARYWAAAAVAVWTLLPGPASPSYWLGLAFQSPSLMSVAICVILVTRSLKDKSLAMPRPTQRANNIAPQLMLLAGSGVLLGWVLLGDTLAWWPVSIYAWGFSTWALALACVPTLSLWCIGGRDRDVQAFKLGISGVLFLFVLTRLPNGNLWDALLDPCLWFALQVMGLRLLTRHGLHLVRGSQATRA